MVWMKEFASNSQLRQVTLIFSVAHNSKYEIGEWSVQKRGTRQRLSESAHHAVAVVLIWFKCIKMHAVQQSLLHGCWEMGVNKGWYPHFIKLSYTEGWLNRCLIRFTASASFEDRVLHLTICGGKLQASCWQAHDSLLRGCRDFACALGNCLVSFLWTVEWEAVWSKADQF